MLRTFVFINTMSVENSEVEESLFADTEEAYILVSALGVRLLVAVVYIQRTFVDILTVVAMTG